VAIRRNGAWFWTSPEYRRSIPLLHPTPKKAAGKKAGKKATGVSLLGKHEETDTPKAPKKLDEVIAAYFDSDKTVTMQEWCKERGF
jgi:hypothetical protein